MSAWAPSSTVARAGAEPPRRPPRAGHGASSSNGSPPNAVASSVRAVVDAPGPAGQNQVSTPARGRRAGTGRGPRRTGRSARRTGPSRAQRLGPGHERAADRPADAARAARRRHGASARGRGRGSARARRRADRGRPPTPGTGWTVSCRRAVGVEHERRQQPLGRSGAPPRAASPSSESSSSSTSGLSSAVTGASHLRAAPRLQARPKPTFSAQRDHLAAPRRARARPRRVVVARRRVDDHHPGARQVALDRGRAARASSAAELWVTVTIVERRGRRVTRPAGPGPAGCAATAAAPAPARRLQVEVLARARACRRAHPAGARRVGEQPRAARRRPPSRVAGRVQHPAGGVDDLRAGRPRPGATTGRPAASASSTAIPNGSRSAQCSRQLARARAPPRVATAPAARPRPPGPAGGALAQLAQRAARRVVASGAPASRSRSPGIAAARERARLERQVGRFQRHERAEHQHLAAASAGRRAGRRTARRRRPGCTTRTRSPSAPADRARRRPPRDERHHQVGCARAAAAHQPADRRAGQQVVVLEDDRARPSPSDPSAGRRSPMRMPPAITSVGRELPRQRAQLARGEPPAGRARAHARARRRAELAATACAAASTRSPRARAASARGPSGQARQRSPSSAGGELRAAAAPPRPNAPE